MRSHFHSFANRAAALLMKVLFGCVGRVQVLGRENANRNGGFLLAANHISHFDPFIISSVVETKIDWMAMAEFFRFPLLRFLLRAVDAFPADRDRADRKTIRTAIERLKNGRVIGLFPEGGIRDGAKSMLEGAPLRPGAATLAHIAGAPIVPCVIVGSDRLYLKRRWLPLRRTPIWIAFGNPVSACPTLQKSGVREQIDHELAAAFRNLYAELRAKFRLSEDDLPHSPQERMSKVVLHPERTRGIPLHNRTATSRDSSTALRSAPKDRMRRAAAATIDSLMCASMNFLQSRHHLHARSRFEM